MRQEPSPSHKDVIVSSDVSPPRMSSIILPFALSLFQKYVLAVVAVMFCITGALVAPVTVLAIDPLMSRDVEPPLTIVSTSGTSVREVIAVVVVVSSVVVPLLLLPHAAIRDTIVTNTANFVRFFMAYPLFSGLMGPIIRHL